MGRRVSRSRGKTRGPGLRWASRDLWIRLASAGVLLVGLEWYVSQLIPKQLSLELAPLVLDARLPLARSLPLRPGSFARRDVLLVTIDTVRPDRLGLYGNAEIETPHLDRFALGSAVFVRAYAVTPLTLPSHASILTGQYPHRHEVRANRLPALAPGTQTLAERLAEQGYDTAAFVSSFVLDARFGLAQGFHLYDDEIEEAPLARRYAERRADETTDRALAWLRTERRSPFFLWVHYYDPHAEYDPPAAFEQSSANAYDGELAFIDQQIGRLIEGVKAASEAEVLTIVTSDHGEGLGEQGEQTHGLLVQEATLKIPLIIGAVGGPPRPARIDGLVSQVDLVPTISSLLGLAPPKGTDGHDLTKRRAPDRSVLVESHYGEMAYGWARLAAIYRNGLKYVDGPHPEFYDLTADPSEENNLVNQREDTVGDLHAQLVELRGPDADGDSTSALELDPEALARLAALGYVSTRRGTVPGVRREGPDPKQMLPQLTRMLGLVAGSERGDDVPEWVEWLLQLSGRAPPRDEGELLAALEKIARESPDFSPVHMELSSLYEKVGRLREAQASRRRLESLLMNDGPLCEAEEGTATGSSP